MRLLRNQVARVNASRLSILITNTTLASRTGTEIVVRDLAAGLARRGHEVGVYTPCLGAIAEEISAASIPVVDDLGDLPFRPRVIHGHHHLETLSALEHLPEARALFVCHDRTAWTDLTPYHPRLRRYVAVDLNCRERLEHEGGIEADSLSMIHNAVDLRRFQRRPPLPDRPQRALVFSNYARGDNFLPALKAACANLSLPLEVIGAGIHAETAQPENILPGYDIVFAKARCALEAMATGCAVILCDCRGMGSLVQRADVEKGRDWNFGARLLTRPVLAEFVEEEIRRYNATDAMAVSDWIRSVAGLDTALESYERIYNELLEPARSDEWERYARRMTAGLQRFASMEAQLVHFKDSPPMELISAEFAKRIDLEVEVPDEPISLPPDEAYTLPVRIRNRTPIALSSNGFCPLRLSYRWAPGFPVDTALRTDWHPAIEPGESRQVRLRAISPDTPGEYAMKITLVQEGYVWLEDLVPDLVRTVRVQVK